MSEVPLYSQVDMGGGVGGTCKPHARSGSTHCLLIVYY